MKSPSLDDKYVLEFLMQGYSLNEFLSILESISGTLEMKNLNPHLKHYGYFNTTFFGILARVKSLLERMIFRAESLRRTMPQFTEIHLSLLEFEKNLDHTQSLISNRKMKEGKEKIRQIAHEYPEIYKRITDIVLNSVEND